EGRRMLPADLRSRARAGDGEAFRELAESHRRELQVHCYRMLGSLQDAEDAVQETMLAAWQGIGGFTEERASLRTWERRLALYARPDLLVLDDFGLQPLADPAPADLYDVINERYETGSILVTSNRAPTEWPDLFGDPLLASAAHAHF